MQVQAHRQAVVTEQLETMVRHLIESKLPISLRRVQSRWVRNYEPPWSIFDNCGDQTDFERLNIFVPTEPKRAWHAMYNSQVYCVPDRYELSFYVMHVHMLPC